MTNPPVYGPAAMPPPLSHNAPFFADPYRYPIKPFLHEFESLATAHELSSQQMVEQVICYVSPDLHDPFMFLDGYATHDWVTFKMSLTRHAETLVRSRYPKQRLQEFTRLASRTRIASVEDVLTYYKRFLILCKPLMNYNLITDWDRDVAFWSGFHPEDRRCMDFRLICRCPDHHRGDPFDWQDVFNAALAEFANRHRFNIFTTEDEWDASSSNKTRKPDPLLLLWFGREAEDLMTTKSDRDRDYYPPSFRRRDDDTPRRKAYHTALSEPAGKAQDTLLEREDQEADDIMTKLQSLSPNEPAYVDLYFRCMHRYPIIAQIFPKPNFDRSPSSVPSSTSAAKASFFLPRDRLNGCVFCTKPGHRIRQCRVAEEYVMTGRAAIHNDRICLSNGQPIPNDGSNRGLQASIDTWLADQTLDVLLFTPDPPPHANPTFQTYGYRIVGEA